MTPKKKVAVAYIPVLHQGYLSYIEYLEKSGVTEIYLVSDEILVAHEELDYINRKDRLRALPHEVMKRILGASTSLRIESLTTKTIFELHEARAVLVAPREDINEFIIETYFGGHAVEFQNVFLRWNKSNLEENAEPKSEQISVSDFERMVLRDVIIEGMKSADWWRQVGAAILKDGEVLSVAHNEHMPEEETPNIFGDTRSLFKKGININYVTTAHAESSAIALVAKAGMSTDGATLITTDFPCPYCARVIAKSGISKIYYIKGYNVLGGDEFFKQLGIEVFKIDSRK